MAPSKRTWRELISELAAFAVLTAAFVLLWQRNGVLFVLMAAGWLGTLALWHERHDVAFFLVLMLLGTAAEFCFVRSGALQYANPTILGVPLWFPPAFGAAGVIGQRLARTLTSIWENRASAA